MVSIRIECLAGNSFIDNVEMSTVVKTDVEDSKFTEYLGKMLYRVESMGYPFSTSAVYDNAVRESNTGKFVNGRYRVIYNDGVVKISIKKF